MIRMGKSAAGICLLIAVTGSPARAQCPSMDLLLAREGATLIFSGTPTKMEPFEIDPPIGGYVVTFAVDAVWKGAAGKTIALYEWWTSEDIHLKLGTRYVIVAIPLRSVHPRTQELPTDLMVDGCTSWTFEEAEKKGWIRELGPSRPPRP